MTRMRAICLAVLCSGALGCGSSLSTIQLIGTGVATNPLNLVGDLGTTAGSGLYTLVSGVPSGCQFPTGTFTMNLLPGASVSRF